MTPTETLRTQLEARADHAVHGLAGRPHLRREHPRRLPPLGDPAQELRRRGAHGVLAGFASRSSRTRCRPRRPTRLAGCACASGRSTTTPRSRRRARSSSIAASTAARRLLALHDERRLDARLLPSLCAGQAKAASVTWSAGFDFTDGVAPGRPPATAPPRAARRLALGHGRRGRVRNRVPRRRGDGVDPLHRHGHGPSGCSITFRAVDVNGNVEATQTLPP